MLAVLELPPDLSPDDICLIVFLIDAFVSRSIGAGVRYLKQSCFFTFFSIDEIESIKKKAQLEDSVSALGSRGLSSLTFSLDA